MLRARAKRHRNAHELVLVLTIAIYLTSPVVWGVFHWDILTTICSRVHLGKNRRLLTGGHISPTPNPCSRVLSWTRRKHHGQRCLIPYSWETVRNGHISTRKGTYTVGYTEGWESAIVSPAVYPTARWRNKGFLFLDFPAGLSMINRIPPLKPVL